MRVWEDSMRNRRNWIIDRAVRWYLGANASVAVVVLLLISLFLFREAIGFFPGYAQALRENRISGMEFADQVNAVADEGMALVRWAHHVQAVEYRALEKQGFSGPEVAAALDPWREVADALENAVSEMRNLAVGFAAQSREQQTPLGAAAKTDSAMREALQTHTRQRAQEGLAAWRELARGWPELFTRAAESLPRVVSSEGSEARALLETLLQRGAREVPEWDQRLSAWSPSEPVSLWQATAAFFTGSEWVTNSFRRDLYGLLPLLTGSLLVAGIALALAVPLGLAGAIYVNQVAGGRERSILKPAIELIAAIPSVVLGFFGIAVLGAWLRTVGSWETLAWLPGFPFDDRIHAFTAGCLLALMAVPTIFTLSEDALRAVPRSYLEASYAVGANRLETIFKVMIPAAASGIASAVLLGFGRVVGETMIVLLCAGNRVAIPDFTEGLGVVFQPVHTLTGIVAQEMGEVVQGSLHYRSLFVIGTILFLLCLGINFAAQRIVRRFRPVI